MLLLWLPVAGVWADGFGTGGAGGFRWMRSAPFLGAVRRSVTLLAWLVGAGMLIGWPAGVWLGLHGFRGRRLFLGGLCFPLLLPPFLVSIALSFLRPWMPHAQQDWLDGLPGCVLAGLQTMIPIALGTGMLIAMGLPPGERAAAELAGGARALFVWTCRRTFPVVLAACALAALRVLSDPGPAQIMGYHGVASEVLIAFAARYDPIQAAQKAVTMTFLMIPLLVPVVWILTSSLRNAFSRNGASLPNSPACRSGETLAARSAGIIAWGLAFLLYVPVLAGIARPLLVPSISGVLGQAWSVLADSAAISVFHAVVAGTTAAVVAWGVTTLAGRSTLRRTLVLWSALLLLSLPTSLYALGALWLTRDLPVFLEPLIRSRWRVGITLGLALSPLPTLMCVWVRACVPPGQEDQRALHGVSRTRFTLRVLLPQVLPVLGAASLAVAILALAEVSAILMLQPPGETTFSGRLFSMMDNAPERLVAGLACVYLAAAMLVVVGVVTALGRYRLIQARNP